MRILDIAVADQEPVVRELVASLLAWLELICKQHISNVGARNHDYV